MGRMIVKQNACTVLERKRGKMRLLENFEFDRVERMS
jgi:hypothetical protein